MKQEHIDKLERRARLVDIATKLVWLDRPTAAAYMGSHHLFTRSGVFEQINLQTDGSMAKPYQIRQVRKILLHYSIS